MKIKPEDAEDLKKCDQAFMIGLTGVAFCHLENHLLCSYLMDNPPNKDGTFLPGKQPPCSKIYQFGKLLMRFQMSGLRSRVLENTAYEIKRGAPTILYDPKKRQQKPQAIDETIEFLCTAYIGNSREILKKYHDKQKPMWEFFRHVRNGCFHGNKFHFAGHSLKNPAEWRGLTITNNLQGKKVVWGFLYYGDVPLLVNDLFYDLTGEYLSIKYQSIA